MIALLERSRFYFIALVLAAGVYGLGAMGVYFAHADRGYWGAKDPALYERVMRAAQDADAPRANAAAPR